MKLQEVIEEIRLKLGASNEMESTIELNEKDLTSIVQASLRELTTFMDTPKFTTIDYSDVIDVSNLKIASILNILRAEAPAGVLSGVSIDPFYLSGSVGVSTQGSSQINTHGIMQTQIQYAVRSMMQNTVQDELSYILDEYEKKLYVSYAGVRPTRVTVVYKPVLNKVEDLPSDYWVNYLVRLATAHAKITMGLIREKYSVASSPYSVNADIKADGISELQTVREELKKTRGAVFD